MWLISVIPITHVPRPQPQVYTYFSSTKSLVAGGIVAVPLGRRDAPALVVEVAAFSPAKKLALKKTVYALRSIRRVLTDEPVIDRATLTLLGQAATKFAGALTLFTKAALPPKLFKNLKGIPKIKWPSLQKKPANSNKNLILSGPKRFEGIAELIKENISINQNAQILIVVPWRERIELWQNLLNRLVINSTTFDTQMSVKKRWQLMAQLASGRLKFIIGTRHALFLPLPNLKLIILDEAQSESYLAFDQQPYFDARFLARLKAKIQNADLVATAPFPPLLKGRTTHTHTPYPAKLETVKPGWAPEIFSATALTAINSALNRNQKVLFYLNRRGEAPLKICRFCAYVPRCPKCNLPLAYHATPLPTLLCHHCGRKSAVCKLCPQCRRDYLKLVGLGTQAIEKTLKTRWPAVPCFRLDHDTAPNVRAKTAIVSAFKKTPGAAVIVGTASLFSLPEPVALAVAPQFDLDLFFPSYRAQEEAFLTLGKLYDLALERVIIQTTTPEAGIFALAKTQNIELFLKRELAVRRALGFPPAVEIAKITLAGRDFSTALALAKREQSRMITQLAFLKHRIPNEATGIEIIGPLQGFHAKKRDAFALSLIVKFTAGTRAARQQLLKIIHPHARIKIDPPDLLT